MSLSSVSAVIDALGGTNLVAAELRPRGVRGTRRARSLNPSVVSSWKARGRIPSANWSGLIELAKRRRVKGITLATLASLEVHAGDNGRGKN